MLNGQRVIVIDSAFGIGLSLANEMHKFGAKVVIGYKFKRCKILAQEQLRASIPMIFVDSFLQKSISSFFSEVGDFDHLVIVDSHIDDEDIMGLSEINARMTMERSFWCKYKVARSALPRIRKRGSITFVTNLSGERQNIEIRMRDVASYAIRALCEGLSTLITSIRTNSVIPLELARPNLPKIDRIKDENMSSNQHFRDVTQAVIAVIKHKQMSGEVLTFSTEQKNCFKES